jgi:hypothetical protein
VLFFKSVVFCLRQVYIGVLTYISLQQNKFTHGEVFVRNNSWHKTGDLFARFACDGFCAFGCFA